MGAISSVDRIHAVTRNFTGLLERTRVIQLEAPPPSGNVPKSSANPFHST